MTRFRLWKVVQIGWLLIIGAFAGIAGYKFWRQDPDALLRGMLADNPSTARILTTCAGGVKTSSGVTLEALAKASGININSGSTAAIQGAIMSLIEHIDAQDKVTLYKEYVDCVIKKTAEFGAQKS